MPALRPVPYTTLVRIFEGDGFTFQRSTVTISSTLSPA